MTPNYETVSAVAASYARRMLRAGYHPEDIAAAFVVAGVALGRTVNGDEKTTDTLAELIGYLGSR